MFNNIISKWRNFVSEAKVKEQTPKEKPARVKRPSQMRYCIKKQWLVILLRSNTRCRVGF